MRAVLMSTMLLWGACAGQDPTEGMTDEGVVDPEKKEQDEKVTITDCTSVVTDIDPLDQAPSVRLNTEVNATFSEMVEDGAWSITVSDPDGNEVKGLGTLNQGGFSATWVSDSNLDVETTYTVEAQVCSNVVTSSFTTVGPPVTKVTVEGNTYALDWTLLDFVEPPLGGGLLRDQVDFDDVLFQFVSIDEKTEEAVVGATSSFDDPPKSGVPGPVCASYVTETADFSTNPFFEFGPQTVEYPAFYDKQGNVLGTVEIEDLTITFEVSADGTKLLNPALSGLIPVEPLLGDSCEASGLITLVQGTCLKCSVAPSGKCLQVDATGKEAGLVVGFDLDQECMP